MYIGVVGCSPRPEVDARWAAEGHGAVVAGEEGALVDDVLVEEGHVIERVHVPCLLIEPAETCCDLTSLGRLLG